MEIKDATPAIIAPELFSRVQERLSRPFRVAGGVGEKYLLQGFIKCECGASMCGVTMNGGHASGPFHYYQCLNTRPRPAHPKSCTARYVRLSPVDEAVWQELTKIILNPELILGELRRRQGAPMAIVGEIAKHERALKNLGDQKAHVVRLYRFGELDDETIEKELKKINRLVADSEAVIRELKARAHLATDFEPLAARVSQYCELIADKLGGFGFAERREVFEALQLSVTVSPAKVVSVFCIVPAAPEESDGYLIARRASACVFQDQGIALLAMFIAA